LWNVTRPQRPASLASPQTNFNDGVTWAAFSPDGSMLATADEDGTVQLWNVADPDGDPLGQPMNADAGPALAIAFSPNGQTIASGYADGSMRLWSIPHLLVTTLIQGDTDGLAFSPDGKVLAASSNYYGAIDLWDIGDDSRARWAGTVNACPGTTVDPIAFSPRSSVLAAGCANGSFRLWDTANPFHVTALSPPLVTGGRSSVNTVSFDKDGKLLAVSDYGGKVTLWNVTDPVHPSRVGTFSTKNTNAWTAVAVSPDGRTVAVSVGSTVHLWDVADPARPHSIGPPLTGPVQALTLLTFSPNGNLVAAGSDDHNVYLWYATGPHVGALAGGGPLVGHTDFVSGVAFSSDGQTLASSSYDQTVRLWKHRRPVSRQSASH
jgi:WD40 repeat protein